MTTPALAAQIAALRAVEERAKGHNERIPYMLASRIGQSGNGYLLAIVLGLARWGVDWTGYDGEVPQDPALMDWMGPAGHRGKRFAGTSAGLGIVDADGGFLREFYRKFGAPKIPDQLLEAHHRDIWHSRYRGTWEAWAVDMLDTPGRTDTHEWIVDRWRRHYWRPARDAFPNDPIRACLNARVRNSNPSLAGTLASRGSSIGDHIDAYEAYIARKHRHNPTRAARARERAEDRLSMAVRAGMVIDLFPRIDAVD